MNIEVMTNLLAAFPELQKYQDGIPRSLRQYPRIMAVLWAQYVRRNMRSRERAVVADKKLRISSGKFEQIGAYLEEMKKIVTFDVWSIFERTLKGELNEQRNVR